jgi:hypothetical protein
VLGFTPTLGQSGVATNAKNEFGIQSNVLIIMLADWKNIKMIN